MTGIRLTKKEHERYHQYKGGDVANYMFTYRKAIERIMTNKKELVNVYITELYQRGLINLKEYDTLKDYSKMIRG